jgi:hypothetical protein
MPEYTETFAKFIITAREEYDQLCASIDAGEVPAGHAVTLSITIPAEDVDRIRFDRLIVVANDG